MKSFAKIEAFSFVFAGLDPAIPIGRALSLDHRDGRDKPGHDG
jgi:hypothetical protein